MSCSSSRSTASPFTQYSSSSMMSTSSSSLSSFPSSRFSRNDHMYKKEEPSSLNSKEKTSYFTTNFLSSFKSSSSKDSSRQPHQDTYSSEPQTKQSFNRSQFASFFSSSQQHQPKWWHINRESSLNSILTKILLRKCVYVCFRSEKETLRSFERIRDY